MNMVLGGHSAAEAPAHRRVFLEAGRLAIAWAAIRPARAQGPAKPLTPAPPGHVVLLGDSVFDNKPYVAGGPDVVTQLRNHLPPGWRATLEAVDGATTRDVQRQLQRVPADATHLVVSVGGNDALQVEQVLNKHVRSVAGALEILASVQEQFVRDYQAMLEAVLSRHLPTAVCTIYDPRFADPIRRRVGTAGLALFNTAITRDAFARGLPVIDLRLVCTQEQDFVHAIEPSQIGGDKIAATIAELVTTYDFQNPRSEVFGARRGG